ncbi:hypothetical protein GGI10_001159 [Coemansia sp. RSA 2530]|nr:hypothetical protein GGI10_001159 [Coemansia sp. RSA 2530]
MDMAMSEPAVSQELAQFFQAIQRVGTDVSWQERAEELAREAGVLGGAATMALLRVHAKFGDTYKFENTAQEARRLLGDDWAAAHGDYAETQAIAYARADLPAQALRVLEAAGGADATGAAAAVGSEDAAGAAVAAGSKDTARAVALQEVLVAWTRARNVDQAWAAVELVQAAGARLGMRGWNALLHMHAVDERYRMELVEAVFQRMGGAGDRATYNILMHAALVRGRQARWQHWLQRMEDAGLAPDAYTHTTLAAALIGAGRWAEAARVIRNMRGAGVAPTRATGVAAMQMQRRRSRALVVMARFRQAVAGGAAISAHEFTQVAGEALAAPRECVAEIALLVRCLEERRVAASPAVDALAARLPGLSARARAARPLLDALCDDPARAGHALAAGLEKSGEPLAAGSFLAAGDRRKSYADTVSAVVRSLLRAGHLRTAEHVVHAAHRAHVFVASAHAKGNDVLVALVSDYVAAGRLGDAAQHVARLERLADSAPSARAFGALLRYAAAARDEVAVDAVWRRMAAAGVGADGGCHRARIACFAAGGRLVRTRRAYADMLDDGHAPHAAAVAALVRCCVRAAHVGLAATVVRHAERHGCAVTPGTYNLIMSRCAPAPPLHRRIDAMFARMLAAPDARLTRAPGDVAADVEALRATFGDLRAVRAGGPRRLEHWLVADDRGWEHTRRALVAWLTSQAAYAGAPSLAGPGVRKVGAPESRPEPEPAPEELAPPPPPNATTFIIAMRFYGQNRRWADVLRAWHAVAEFNARVSALAATHPFAEHYRVVPFSRMVGWAARALLESGRPREARVLWHAAARDGTLSENARRLGMEEMTRRLRVHEDRVY